MWVVHGIELQKHASVPSVTVGGINPTNTAWSRASRCGSW